MEETIIKRHGLTSGLFMLAVVLVVAITGSYVVRAMVDYRNIPDFYPREITVSAEGKVSIVPDIVLLNFGVTTDGVDVPTIVGQNASKMNAIINMLKVTENIDAKDITTTQYSLEPRYEYAQKTGVRTFKGYTMSQQVAVKVRDFTKIGDVLNQATALGSNLVGNLQFAIDDTEKATQQARDKAIENAKAKAQSMADAAGMKLGKIVNIQDSSYPYYGGGLYEKSMDTANGLGVAAPAPQIESGQTEVTANIYITYRIK